MDQHGQWQDTDRIYGDYVSDTDTVVLPSNVGLICEAFLQLLEEFRHLLHEIYTPLRWRHNDHAGVSNHQPHGCLLNRLFRRKSKKTSKLRVTGLCAGNSPGTGEFPAQMASYAENVSIWWRHHADFSIRGLFMQHLFSKVTALTGLSYLKHCKKECLRLGVWYRRLWYNRENTMKV